MEKVTSLHCKKCGSRQVRIVFEALVTLEAFHLANGELYRTQDDHIYYMDRRVVDIGDAKEMVCNKCGQIEIIPESLKEAFKP